MKKFIPTLALLSVLCGLMAYAYFYEREPVRDKDKKDVVVVQKLDPDSVERIEIDEGYNMITLEKVDGKWRLTVPYDSATADIPAKNLVDAVTKLKAETKLDDVSSLADFGLTEPERKITAFLKSGGKEQLIIGGKSPVGNKRYVMKNGAGAVYVVDSFNVNPLMKSAFDLRDKSVVDDFDRDNVTTVVVMTPDKDTVCARNADEKKENEDSHATGTVDASATATADTGARKDENEKQPKWSFINRPGTNCESEANAIMSWLDYAEAKGFEDEEYPPLIDFGLVSPRYKLILWMKDNSEIKLEVGNFVGSEVYVRNANRDKVYKVERALTEKIEALKLAESKLH